MGALPSFQPWSLSTALLSLLIILPLAVVLLHIFQEGPQWATLWKTVLPGYLWHTLIVLLLTLLFASLFAILPAWFIATQRFPLRDTLSWALLLPLAVPTYIAGFVTYQDQEHLFPLLVWIKNHWGLTWYQRLDLTLRYLLLSLTYAVVLSPYLYLSMRTCFAMQRAQVIEAAQSLGKGPTAIFLQIALPLSRPALIAGMSLIAMEVINDYGAAHHFGITTLTEGIFRTWFDLGDRVSALRLASLMLFAILLVLAIEGWQRGRSAYHDRAQLQSPLTLRQLRGPRSVLTTLLCSLPLLLGFLYPCIRLLQWSHTHWKNLLALDFWEPLLHSLWVALLIALLLPLLSLLITYSARLSTNRALSLLRRISTLGYAVPGAIIAIGVLITVIGLDRFLAGLGWKTWIAGSLLTLCFAYLIRFLTVSYQPIHANMQRLCGSLDEASRTLGKTPLHTLLRINLPLLLPTLLGAGILCFIDTLKELPLTLILRPADYETLATTTFGLATEGRIYQSALPALLIIALGSLSLLLYQRLQPKRP